MTEVINEWLFQDIKGENGQPNRTGNLSGLPAQAIERRKELMTRFAALNVFSPWMTKAHELMTHSAPDIRRLSKLLRSLIINPSMCVILQPDDVSDAAPQDAIDAAPDEDIYLIQTYYAADADLLITTDEGLHDAFVSRQDVEVIFRNEFLNDYLNE